MKRFMRGIYLFSLLWIACFFYYGLRLKIRGAILRPSKTGGKILNFQERSGLEGILGPDYEYVPVPPDNFAEYFYWLLFIATLVWIFLGAVRIFLGAVRLVIRFLVRTIQKEKQKIDQEEKQKIEPREK